MRLRKQPKATQVPGDAFLRAVSSGRPAQRPAAPVASDDPGLRQQLLDSQQRAEAAEEALRQIREESRLRLEEARQALSAEREARKVAEAALAQAAQAPERAPAQPEAAVQPDPEPEDDEHHPSEGPPLRDTVQVAEGDEEEWPTPWLDQGKRGLFRR